MILMFKELVIINFFPIVGSLLIELFWDLWMR